MFQQMAVKCLVPTGLVVPLPLTKEKPVEKWKDLIDLVSSKLTCASKQGAAFPPDIECL